MRWSFGPFELVPVRGRLARGGNEVALARKSYEILVHLVRHRDRVVSRGEILDVCWNGVVVSEAALASAIRDLRRALGDAGRGARFVATVRGRGFRFVHPVRELPDLVEPAPGSAWARAAVHFERALRALELVDESRGAHAAAAAGREPRQRGELLVALARARWAAGATTEARPAFLDAARVARACHDSEVLAQAALGFVGRTDVTPGVNHEAVALLEEALRALPHADGAVRAEVLARLGTELYYDPDPHAADRTTAESLAMAERLGDPQTIAYACTARHFALQRPEVGPEGRRALWERAIELCGEGPPSDVLAFALQEKLVDCLEAGDGSGFDDALRRHQSVVDGLDQPFFRWTQSLYRGNRVLLSGQVEAADRLAHESLALAERIGSPNAAGAFAAQLFAIRREQGRLHELAPALEEAVRRNPTLPIFRAALAAALAASPAPEKAGDLIEAMVRDDLRAFPRDMNWIPTLGTLAPAVAEVGAARRVRDMIELMLPYAGRMIVVGHGSATHGAVSHHLGLLSRAAGDGVAARRHFRDARALHARMGAPLWEARSLRESQVDP